jgi:putative NADH-flavin reductase
MPAGLPEEAAMEVVVIGGGGRTGRLVVAEALARGHHVTAYVRRPEAAAEPHERLAVACGDVLDPTAVTDVLAGKDAVITVLGVRNRSTTTVFSQGITNIVRAMEAKGVRRVMTVSTAGLDIGRHMPLPQRLVAEYIVERVLRNIYLDLARMEDELELSQTDWTVIRPPRLTGQPATGRYRTGRGGIVDRPRSVSRADLAEFMVSHLEDPATYRQKIAISH